ncbi:MAG: MerR family transcriptional regulator [Tannerella sp.]|nr:MerR family transcriptional regulator [Tannerella sp.]
MEKFHNSIKDVAKILGENESTLRFWEEQFPDVIAPHRNETGHRSYTEKDIDDLRALRLLLRDVGMTTEGAQKHLKGNKRSSLMRRAKAIDKLERVKSELKALEKALNSVGN